MSNVTPDSIIQIASGFMAAKHLFMANEIGLFEQLGNHAMTLDELAQSTGIPRRTLRIIADAVVALGFVEKSRDQYANTAVADTFLSGKTPADLRLFLRFWDKISYPNWINLEPAIRNDRPALEWGNRNLSLEEEQIFTEGIESITAGIAHALASTYDFSQHQHILDLGGGTGSFLLAIIERLPGLDYTLFEIPATASIARTLLNSKSNGAQIKVVEGDFFKDALPGGQDAVILANVVHLFTAERNQDLFRRIRNQVSDGTRLLLVDYWTDPTHTQPVFAALLAGEFMVINAGDVYSVEEIHNWLSQTGWKALSDLPLEGPASLIVAEAVHKN